MDTSKATSELWQVCAGDKRSIWLPDVVKPIKCGSIERAALIVRAVNSHEALVAALRDLLDGSEPWDERATQARAALALAEQGGG